MRKPNFLLITTDQQCADHVGCYGNTQLRTPVIDKLAQQGRRFDRFYVASGVCMPNRASLMTGRLPSLHDTRCNGIPLSRSATTFVDVLRAAGYKTGLVGKCHLQNMTDMPPEMPAPVLPEGKSAPPAGLEDAMKNRWWEGGYDMELLRRWREDASHRVQAPYYGFDHIDLATMHGDLVEGDYARWLADQVGDIDRVRGQKNALKDERYSAPQAWRTRVPEHQYPTAWTGDRAEDFIELAAKDAQPFFLHCSFADPHHPFTPPGKYWDMYDPEDIILPRSFYADYNQCFDPVKSLHAQREGGCARKTSTVGFAATEREAKESLALTYGMITMIDDTVGRILKKLEALGLDQDTIVIFTSDHGDFMGSHGLLLKSALHYQSLIRVPFIWTEPSGVKMQNRGSTTCALASTLDISTTILSRAGLAPYYGIQGVDLLPVVQEDHPGLRSAVLIEEDGHAPTFALDHPVRARTVVTDLYRLTVYDEGNWVELYDLENDPDELNNLAQDPAYATLRSQMFEVLARELMLSADRSPFPLGRA
ncbi:sulfatase-like hydrolase/transferase [Pusillimonas sp. DMV24BSW_D]|uniref:sulfatase family protein n=1 Tax=Neopusillimonas aestuarii TaxID=2716226 RepID=UPI00140E828D|nr:sulfatase-like hydrolase/transferase [Pusillimonas sp. DMV24BSW_D]QIM48805.1 sulfatase-like hydrolase/transferase [Pusillimonas sp. DMV24BSW_D]